MSRLISNYFFTVLYQLLLIATPFITTPYISRVLEAEGIGIDAYVSSIVQLFIVFIVLSLPKYGSRQIASKQTKKDASSEFVSIFIFQAMMATLNIIAFLVFIGTVSEHKELFYLHFLTLLAYSFDISWFFIGKEQIKKISIRNMIVKVAGVILIFTFVNDANDLPLYIIINASTLLVGQIIMWVLLFKELTFVKIKLQDIKAHVVPIAILFFPELMIQVYVLVNRIILGNISGEIEVGYYNQANKIVKIALGVISSLGIVLLPRMSSEFAKGNQDLMKKYVHYTMQFVLLITLPMTFGMMAIAPNFVSWFLGDEFLEVSTLLIVMSPVIFFVGLANVFGIQILISTNQQKKYSIAITIGAILSLIINFLLVFSYASLATTIALVVAEAVGAIIQMYFARKYFNFKQFSSFFIKYFILSIVLYICVFLTGQYVETIPIILTFVQIAIGGIVYLIGLLIMKDSMMQNLVKIIKNKIS